MKQKNANAVNNHRYQNLKLLYIGS